MEKPNLEDCKQQRKDCVCCNAHGQCVALNNTVFKHYDGTIYKCPFYKSKAEVLNENH